MGERIHPKSGKVYRWGKREVQGLIESYDSKLRKKVYTIEYYLPNLKKKREKIGTCKRDALDRLAEVRTEIRNIKQGRSSEFEIKKKLQFEEISGKFLNEYSRPPRKEASSCARDKFLVKNLNKFFGNKFLHQITRESIEDYQNKRLDEGKSHSTINREVACMKTIFNKAIDWKLTKENPASKIKMLREPPPIVRYLATDEIEKLLKGCEMSEAKHLYPIVFVALNTGMRLDEILKLKWRDVDLPNGYIHIEKAKGGKRRDIPLNSELTNLLRFSIKKPNTEYLFCDENDKPFSNINRSWKTAKRRAGIKNFRFHDLRHSFASYLVMSGVDLYTVSKLLGHSSVEVTQRYAHLSPKYKKMAVEVLSKVFTQYKQKIDTLKAPSEIDNAGVAQLVEQGFCKPQVVGSNPIASSRGNILKG